MFSGGSKGSIGKKRVKSYYDNKEECKKLEIRNLQTQIEHLKKEHIDLKSKAKITKLPENTKSPAKHRKIKRKHSRTQRSY